jgi:hypothetical protein
MTNVEPAQLIVNALLVRLIYTDSSKIKHHIAKSHVTVATNLFIMNNDSAMNV